MKLIEINYHGGEGKEVSVEDAIKAKLGQTDYYSRGSVATEEMLSNTQDVLATLISKLVENNILKLEDIDSMLSFRHTIVDED